MLFEISRNFKEVLVKLKLTPGVLWCIWLAEGDSLGRGWLWIEDWRGMICRCCHEVPSTFCILLTKQQGDGQGTLGRDLVLTQTLGIERGNNFIRYRYVFLLFCQHLHGWTLMAFRECLRFSCQHVCLEAGRQAILVPCQGSILHLAVRVEHTNPSGPLLFILF